MIIGALIAFSGLYFMGSDKTNLSFQSARYAEGFSLSVFGGFVWLIGKFIRWWQR